MHQWPPKNLVSGFSRGNTKVRLVHNFTSKVHTYWSFRHLKVSLLVGSLSRYSSLVKHDRQLRIENWETSIHVHTFVITRPRLIKIKENKSSRHQEVVGPVNSPLSRSCGANVKVVNCLVESLCGGKDDHKARIITKWIALFCGSLTAQQITQSLLKSALASCACCKNASYFQCSVIWNDFIVRGSDRIFQWVWVTKTVNKYPRVPSSYPCT